MQTETTKPEVAPVPIWRCRNSECKAWVREEMAMSPSPDCPLCKGEMIRSFKHLDGKDPVQDSAEDAMAAVKGHIEKQDLESR